MSDVKLVGTARETFGKGSARQARRDGNIPAVIYSHGGEAQHVLVDAHEAFLIIKNHRNALVTITIGKKNHKAIIKDVQRDAIGRVVEHIDFLAVKAGEKQTIDVPVVLVGDVAPGAQVTLDLHNASISADVAALPEHVEVSVEGLEAGTVLYVKDIELPKGQAFENDPEQVVAVVSEIVAELEEDEVAVEGSEAAPAEAE